MAELSPAERAACQAVQSISDWAIPHVTQVEQVAGWLFQALHPYHGLGAGDETLLRAAGLLHDVGFPTDPDDHHRVSARIIRAHLGGPFSAGHVETIALLARYHRQSPPKLKHRRYAALDPDGRRQIGWLGGILRVADGLDRNHDAAVRWLEVSRIDGLMEIRVSGAAAAGGERVAALAYVTGGSAPTLVDAPGVLEQDVRGGMRKRDLLERMLGMPVVIRAV